MGLPAHRLAFNIAVQSYPGRLDYRSTTGKAILAGRRLVAQAMCMAPTEPIEPHP